MVGIAGVAACVAPIAECGGDQMLFLRARKSSSARREGKQSRVARIIRLYGGALTFESYTSLGLNFDYNTRAYYGWNNVQFGLKATWKITRILSLLRHQLQRGNNRPDRRQPLCRKTQRVENSHRR